MERIGVRELRQHASRYLARVAGGESIEVTDRGRPVAMLVPLPQDPWADLVERGLVSLPTLDLLDVEPVELAAGTPSLSDELAALRDDER
jgi:prevent-host-death family protein